MPNNRQVAEQRALSVKRKFEKDENFQREYTAFLENAITKGHAEIVPHEQIQEKGKPASPWCSTSKERQTLCCF